MSKKRLLPLILLLFSLILAAPIHAKTKIFESNFFTLELSNAIQKKYVTKEVDYASSHYIYFYDKSAFNAGNKKEIFYIAISLDYPSDISSKGNRIFKGAIYPAWKAGGAVCLYYDSTASNASRVLRDMNSVFKTMKMKSGYKFYRFNPNKFSKWKQIYYNFLTNGTLRNGTKIDIYMVDEFRFLCLNNNSVPEMLLYTKPRSYGTNRRGMWYLISCKNGAVEGAFFDPITETLSVKYIKKGNRILFHTGYNNRTCFNDYIYYINSNSPTLKCFGNYGNFTDGKRYYWNSNGYYNNMKKVTKKQYIIYRNRAFNKSKAVKLPSERSLQQIEAYLLFGRWFK